jgi:hypothetical protein
MDFYWKSQRFDKKSRNFWVADFFLEIFKTHRLLWISQSFWLFKICFIKVLFKIITVLILNFTNAVLSKTTL